MSYLMIFLLLGAIIWIHELGHFLAAKWLGIPVKRFSIGFGRVLWKRSWRGTEYCLAWLPVGGYVQPDIEDDNDFYQILWWKRIGFALAGPLANIIAAVAGFALANMVMGQISFQSIFIEPFGQTLDYVGRFAAAIPAMFENPKQISGLVGIVAKGGAYVGFEPLRMIQFAIMLNINLAIMNLLPLLPLDGGNIVMFISERIFPPFRKLHIPAALAGWVLLIAVMLYATFQDVSQLYVT